MKAIWPRAAVAIISMLALLGIAVGQDKRVNVYNWSDYIDPSILTAFTKETGIQVTYDVFDSNDTLETKLLAGRTGYDVVVPSAHFLGRQIKAGVFLPLDKSKLPNLANMWPQIMQRLAKYDPGNAHAVDYMWGTTGLGYNVAEIRARMPDAPIDSWRMVMDPKVLAKFADCGVMMLDASDEIVPITMLYLGIDPDSHKPEDFDKAAAYFRQLRPYVRKFHSSEYINALANGDVCLVVGWSGDIKQAAARAAEKNGAVLDQARKVEIRYVIPKEGAQVFFDCFAIPKDAPHVEEALTFINYMMRPQAVAKASDFIRYPNGNLASQTLLQPAVRNDETVYPPAALMAKLFSITPYNGRSQRALTDAFREMKHE